MNNPEGGHSSGIEQEVNKHAGLETQGEAKAEQKETDPIESARDMDELFAAIRKGGDIQGSRDTYTPDQLIHDMNLVRIGKAPRSSVTRAKGIRKKFAELLRDDPEYKKTQDNIRAAVTRSNSILELRALVGNVLPEIPSSHGIIRPADYMEDLTRAEKNPEEADQILSDDDYGIKKRFMEFIAK